MSKLVDAVAKANSVMDGAATFIASMKAAVAAARQEASDAGVTLSSLDNLATDLDTHAAALASAFAENTTAAPAEQPTPESAPVADPATAPPAGDATEAAQPTS